MILDIITGMSFEMKWTIIAGIICIIISYLSGYLIGFQRGFDGDPIFKSKEEETK